MIGVIVKGKICFYKTNVSSIVYKSIGKTGLDFEAYTIPINGPVSDFGSRKPAVNSSLVGSVGKRKLAFTRWPST